VALMTTAVIGLALLVEGETFWGQEYLSVNDCVFDSRGRRAVSLLWSQPTGGVACQMRLGNVALRSGRSFVQPLWPQIEPVCLADAPQAGRLFLGTLDGMIYSASAASLQESPALVGRSPGKGIFALKCSPDGRHLFSLGWSGLCAWDVESRTMAWRRDDVDANCLCVDPCSRSLVCGLGNGEVVEMDFSSGETLRSIAKQDSPILEVNANGDGKLLTCTSGDGQILLLNWPSGTRVWQSPGPASSASPLRVAAFSPCGRFFVTSAHENGRTLAILDLATGERIGELRGHAKVVLGAAFADDGRLFSWGADGTIRTWDVAARRSLGVASLSVPSPAS
jgi:hypothetical protein